MKAKVKCPVCGNKIPAPLIKCARCGHKVQPAACVVAPIGSKYVGRFVCTRCIDGTRAKMEPSETKGA